MDTLRLDKWLWAARFFKTRSLCRQAIDGGKVQLNGVRVKPSRPLKPGDDLAIRREQEVMQVEVLALSARRGPAAQAQLLYRESADSITARELAARQRKLLYRDKQQLRRPDKRQRREAIKVKQFKPD